jgi:biopolymer transport protein ExbD
MAEINTDGGGGHGKGAKKGRKKAGNPRVDMTPMVDLAFLLLTFFVLTSNLNKAKTMEMTVPKDSPDTSKNMKVDDDLAHTVLLDGNKKEIIYIYAGDFKKGPPLNEFVMDPKDAKSVRSYIGEKNSKVSGEMKQLRKIYKTNHLTSGDVQTLQGVMQKKLDPTGDSITDKRRQKFYDSTMVRLNIDVKRGFMSDTTYKLVSATIRDDNKAPFFIIKWGGDAKYNDIINIIDELKIGDVSKYALVKISRPELEALSSRTGINYPELSEPDPNAVPAGQTP